MTHHTQSHHFCSILLPLVYRCIALENEDATKSTLRSLTRYPWLPGCVRSLTCRPPRCLDPIPSMPNLESLGPVASLVDQLSKLEIFTWKALYTPDKAVWSGLRKKYVRYKIFIRCLECLSNSFEWHCEGAERYVERFTSNVYPVTSRLGPYRAFLSLSCLIHKSR